MISPCLCLIHSRLYTILFIHFSYPSLIYFSPWVTCSICCCDSFAFCSASASWSLLSIIHLCYNRFIISSNTIEAPRGERGELCWAHTPATSAAKCATKLFSHEKCGEHACSLKQKQSGIWLFLLLFKHVSFLFCFFDINVDCVCYFLSA